MTNASKPVSSGFKLYKPEKKDFEKNINEFWFEVYHVAKYLSRDDLWTAKSRDNSAKNFLLQMLEWNQGLKLNWNFRPKDKGKEMKQWISEDNWKRLHHCYGTFYSESSWNALINTVELYSSIAKETARILNYNYDQKQEENFIQFIEQIRNNG